MKINLTFGIRIYDLLKHLSQHRKCSQKDILRHSVHGLLKKSGANSLKKVNSLKTAQFSY